MALTVGSHFAHYEVTARIGAGGMGEVYRARDTRLHRDVAVKVLPDAMVGHPERLARFEREALVLASLKHPNIAHLYGLEDLDGLPALIMELVDGPTLDEVIRQGLTISAALDIAEQIADALEAAHDAGVVHRDLKPGNVKIAGSFVKVLDFGLAKALDPDGVSGQDAANSPTITNPGTLPGVILGTAAYMAPEQATGRAVDKRADIWAFGAVLYEMLAQRRAFAGDNTTETLAAVVLKDPDWSALPPATPARLRDLVRRCLQKDPRRRTRDIGDVRIELKEIREATSAVEPLAAVGRPRLSRRWMMAALVGGGLLAAGVLGYNVHRIAPPALTPAGAPATRFLEMPQGMEWVGGVGLSRDGSVMVFEATGQNSFQLYARGAHEFVARPLPQTETIGWFDVSPDGQWVAFFADGKIKRVSTDGNVVATVCETPSVTDLAWGPGDTILFTPSRSAGLYSVKGSGGVPTILTSPDPKEREQQHRWPDLLPGDRKLLFTIWTAGSGVNEARIALLDLATRRYQVLFPGAEARYLSGHILYFHAGAWQVVAFDAATGTTSGRPQRVLDDARGIFPNGGSRFPTVAVSWTGTVAYVPGHMFPKRSLAWLDRRGQVTAIDVTPQRIGTGTALSPDGKSVVMSRFEAGGYELWMQDLTNKSEGRLPVDGSLGGPDFSPDGKEIAFSSMTRGVFDIYRVGSDGGGPARPLLVDGRDHPLAAFGADGWFAMAENRQDGAHDFVLVDPTGARHVLGQGPGYTGAFSLDGRWLAYDDPRGQLSVIAVPPPTPATPLNLAFGDTPMWSRASRELLYSNGNEIKALPYEVVNGRFVPGTERTFVRLPKDSDAAVGQAPDGRILITRSVEPLPTPGARVIVNWFDEIKSKGR